MKFVATKTVEQLDLQALHRVRERLVSQRTGIINQIYRLAFSATNHKKNYTEDPSNREADKHKLAQRRTARQFGCL
jgi:transposase